MQPFDLEEAQAGKPVVTRCGKAARIVCFDSRFRSESGNEYPILALVTNNDGITESPVFYDYYGRPYDPSNACTLNLCMAPGKHEEWK